MIVCDDNLNLIGPLISGVGLLVTVCYMFWCVKYK
jgi:hypothetical protein